MAKLTMLIILCMLVMAGCAAPSSRTSHEPVEATPFTLDPSQSVSSDDPTPPGIDMALQPTKAPEMMASPSSAAAFSRVQIYLVALDDNSQNGQKIGCGDSLVPVDREITPTIAPLRAAIEELLAVQEQYYGQSGLYNALYQSDLQVENIVIDANGKATIHLSGSYALGGVCDTPRFEAQLEETARQFSTVKDVAIFINGTPLEEALSLFANPAERHLTPISSFRFFRFIA